MLCPIKANSKTIELTVHNSCCCVLDLLCVTWFMSAWNILAKNSTGGGGAGWTGVLMKRRKLPKVLNIYFWLFHFSSFCLILLVV